MNNQDGKKRYKASDEEVLLRIPERKGNKRGRTWLVMDGHWTALLMNLKYFVENKAVEELKHDALDVADLAQEIIDQEEEKYDNYVSNAAGMVNLQDFKNDLRIENEYEPKEILRTCQLLADNAETIIEEANKAGSQFP